MLISAGETPEIREAWPTVSGRIFVSFCRASARKLGTVFGGTPEIGLTIEELLARETKL